MFLNHKIEDNGQKNGIIYNKKSIHFSRNSVNFFIISAKEVRLRVAWIFTSIERYRDPQKLEDQ